MKKLVYFLSIIGIFTYYSCGSDLSNNTDEQVESEESVVEKENEISSCEKFLQNYEEFADKFVEKVDKLVETPDDNALKAEIKDLQDQKKEWDSKWTKLTECTGDADIQQEYEAITDLILEAKGLIQ